MHQVLSEQAKILLAPRLDASIRNQCQASANHGRAPIAKQGLGRDGELPQYPKTPLALGVQPDQGARDPPDMFLQRRLRTPVGQSNSEEGVVG